MIDGDRTNPGSPDDGIGEMPWIRIDHMEWRQTALVAGGEIRTTGSTPGFRRPGPPSASVPLCLGA